MLHVFVGMFFVEKNMEKKTKTEVTVLKFKFRTYKSISIGSIPRFLYLLWRHRTEAHQSSEGKKQLKILKSQNLHPSCICKHWFSQKVSTLHLDVPGYIFHPVTKYHKRYNGITCTTRKKQFCVTLIKKLFVSSWSELQPLKSCIILVIGKAVLTLQSPAIPSAYPMANLWCLNITCDKESCFPPATKWKPGKRNRCCQLLSCQMQKIITL